MIDEQNQVEQTLEDLDLEEATLTTDDDPPTTEQTSATEEASENTAKAEQGENISATEITSLIKALQQDNANLKQQLDKEREDLESLKLQYARLAADFENFRKRTQREKEELQHQVKKQTISDLLAVVDNFERARSQIKPASEGEKLIHNSYQGVYKTFVEALKNLGVSAMKAEGELFDPNYHEAMLREETEEHPEDTVIEQLRRGYLLGDKVLRHALVKVAVPKQPVITSEEEEQEEEILEETEE